ncbi:MAG: hypothetical protein GF333_00895 [Candidatus Omnitrophica bacterium]|nr:hypothetical protein [Candidatus Omnitrophota bacterium]
MLYKFRNYIKHIGSVLVVIVIAVFVFWGALSYMRRGEVDTVGTIGGHEITRTEFQEYYRMAQLHYDLVVPREQRMTVTPQNIYSKAWEFLLILWKARQEQIKISDQEVVDMIQLLFYQNREFDPQQYERFVRRNLGMEPRLFEEYIRKFIKIQKVEEEYIDVEIAKKEVRELFRKDTQKAKIAYLILPYDEYKENLTASPAEIKEFYEKHQPQFEQEAKVKIRYLVLNEDTPNYRQILQESQQVETLTALSENHPVEIQETGYIGINDPLAGMGWQQAVNRIAFQLEMNAISPPLRLQDDTVLIQKTGAQPAAIPPLEEIRAEVKEKVIHAKAVEKVADEANQLLAKLKEEKQPNLPRQAEPPQRRFQETDFFGYHDYIEGVGLDEHVSEIVFSLKPEEIHDEPLMLMKGAYIIQLRELTPFAQDAFKEQREEYESTLFRQKYLAAKTEMLASLQQDADLAITAPSL